MNPLSLFSLALFLLLFSSVASVLLSLILMISCLVTTIPFPSELYISSFLS
ncbi:hypothetical protein LINPERPRIM_LOCUS5184 [Linum perenne]